MMMVRYDCPIIPAGETCAFVPTGYELRQSPFDLLFIRNDSAETVDGNFDGNTDRGFTCGSGERIEITDELFNFITMKNEGAGNIAAGDVKVTFQSEAIVLSKWRRRLWG